jgi:uncharacterized lipoprotein YmbA
MTTVSKKALGMMLVCSVLAVHGCSRSPRVNFYTLAATAPRGETAPARQLPAIAVGTVTLPEFADRPQFVIVNPDNRVDILEMHQWAESLKSAIPRIIADNLSRQLGTDRVSAYPQQAATDDGYRVAIDFQRFESTGNAITIDALWTINRGGEKSFTGRTRTSEPCTNGLDTVAVSYSRALATVSADIARHIQKEIR